MNWAPVDGPGGAFFLADGRVETQIQTSDITTRTVQFK